MRRRISLLILSAALLAGCSSSGTVGAGTGAAPGNDTRSAGPAPAGGSSTASSPTPSGSVPATGGLESSVVIGTGAIPVTVYEDYRCPPCKQIHDRIQPVLDQAVAAGKVKVTYHALNLVDHGGEGKGSLAAANAASCAFKAGKFQPYHDALFAAQPDESDDAFADPATLITIAKTIPGLDSPDFETCVTTQPYAGSIKSTFAAISADPVFQGTPTILINGRKWQTPSSPDQAASSFTKALDQAG
ncbi:MAG: thioredoxin domain-containing protein [Catenulispora sp.]|nr:thioredoxin domain-containing protein [Catenulispora sp.]